MAGRVLGERHDRLLDAVSDVGGLLLTLAAAYLYAALLGIIALRFPRQGTLLFVPAAGTLLFPLGIAHDSVLFRAFAAVLCLDMFLKVADYGRQCQNDPQRRSLAEFGYLLPPFPVFLAVIEEKKRLAHPDTSLRNLGRILAGALGTICGYAVVLYLNQFEALQQSFLLDHLIKVAVFIFTVEMGARLFFGLERLAGFDTTLLVRNVFLSVTVAEFWLRWNNRVHRWLKANLFRPAARRFGRVGGLIAVFGFSGLFHELAFDVATGHVDGYQMAFFLLQAPMVLLSDYASPALRRRRPWVQAPMYVLTVLWMTATSVLFLRGVDRVFPFVYASEPWLP